MSEPRWVKRFADARRPGLYVRVLEPGEIAVGDPVERLGGGDGPPDRPRPDGRLVRPGRPTHELLERAARSPLAVARPRRFEKKLARVSV